jgi:hypothetical protein
VKRFYLCLEEELLIVDEETQGYRVQPRLSGLRPLCLAIDPFDKQSLYCGTFGNGLWLSKDGGETWYPSQQLGQQQTITAVATSPTHPQQVWVGTEPSALFFSSDGGQTWTERQTMQFLPSKERWSFPPRPETHHIRWITENPLNPQHITIAIEAGAVLRSTDGGHTWEDTKQGNPVDAHVILMHAQAPNRLYAACGDGLWDSERSFLQSVDGGESWQGDSEGLAYHYLYGLAVSPYDPDILLAAAASSPKQAHFPAHAHSMLYRKQGTDSWQPLTNGLLTAPGTLISSLATDPDEPQAFYALNNQGLYYSPDLGLTWQKLSLPWKEVYRNSRVHALAVRQTLFDKSTK